MKATEIDHPVTAEAVTHLLRLIGVKPADAIMYVSEKPPNSDGVAMLIATPIGLLQVTDTITSRARGEWQMASELIAWSELAPRVTIKIDRGSRFDGMATEWIVALSQKRELSITTNSASETMSPSGVEAFVAAVLRWTDPFRAPTATRRKPRASSR